MAERWPITRVLRLSALPTYESFVVRCRKRYMPDRDGKLSAGFFRDSFGVVGIKPLDCVGQNLAGKVFDLFSRVGCKYAKLSLGIFRKTDGIPGRAFVLFSHVKSL
jgi:hypothetical protein